MKKLIKILKPIMITSLALLIMGMPYVSVEYGFIQAIKYGISIMLIIIFVLYIADTYNNRNINNESN